MVERDFRLPDEILEGASFRGNEYGWIPAAFPEALRRAESRGYACLGGQFQFRLPEATCEMYWVDADSTERLSTEEWPAYCQRSCAEVRTKFTRRIEETDFMKEALDWPIMRRELDKGLDLNGVLVFVASFVTEAQYDELGS